MRIEELRAENKKRIEKVTREKEDLRKDKDREFADLTEEKEKQRVNFEETIIKLDVELKKSKTLILSLTSTIFELKEVIV